MIDLVQLKALVSFGLILGAALSNGRIAQKFKLPAITGFLLTGLLAGPSMLGFINADQVAMLQPIDHVALSFIALVAGSELKLNSLRSQLGATLLVMLGLTVATFAFTSTAIYMLSPWIPALSQVGAMELYSAAILLGVVMVARSPSAAIAMIDELKAKGRFTQLILGVTVLMDVVVITLFAAALSLSKSLTAGEALSLSFVKGIGAELFISGALGSLLFCVLRGVLRERSPAWLSSIALLGLSAGVFYLAEWSHHATPMIGGLPFHFDPLLTCLIAGVWISNYNQTSSGGSSEESGEESSRGSETYQSFKAQVSTLSPWVYLSFFTITGASLKLDLLVLVWPLALVLFAVRLLGLKAGATVGGALAREPAHQHAYRWMGFVTQAGVGLGLAKRIATEFPTWGPSLATLIIGVIVMNEILGPLFFKRAIISSGESYVNLEQIVQDSDQDHAQNGAQDGAQEDDDAQNNAQSEIRVHVQTDVQASAQMGV